MIAVSAGSIRARRRKTAVLFVFFAELAWSLLVATPVHAWARRAWGAHPDGDALLFGGGARDLMMWLGREDAALPVTVRVMMVLLVVGGVVMQLPLGALIASLAFARDEMPGIKPNRGLSVIASLRVGIGALLPLAALLALGTLAGVIVIGLGLLASGAIGHSLVESLGDARAFEVRMLVLGIFGLLTAMAGVFVDLARVAIGREAGLGAMSGTTASAWTMLLRGIRVAGTTSRRAFFRATFAWALRAVTGLLLLGVGYAAADALGGRGGGALWTLFAIHQSVVLLRVGLRASWLAVALGYVAPVQDELALGSLSLPAAPLPP